MKKETFKKYEGGAEKTKADNWPLLYSQKAANF